MAIEILETFYNDEAGETQERVACPLCGRSDEALVLLGRDLLFRRPGYYRLVRCRHCNLEYVNPRPTQAALGVHYPSDYFGYALHEDAPKLLTPLLQSYALGISKRRLAYLEKVTGPVQPAQQLLDVGCGVNRLLAHVQQARGCEGLGLDFKPEIVAHVRRTLGMPIVEGTLSSAGFESGRFDTVFMMEYLEHEADPLALLQEARRITRSGGYLALELPHIASLPGRLFRSLWWNLDVPRHLVFPAPKTVGPLLARAGFELQSVKTFTLPFYVGMSVLQVLGQRHWRKHKDAFPVLSALLGAPFLPFQALLPEFMFVVAKAI